MSRPPPTPSAQDVSSNTAVERPPTVSNLDYEPELVFVIGVLACATALGSLMSGAAQAQTFPAKPVTIVVPFPPAGGADTLARILATHLGAVWKQQARVDLLHVPYKDTGQAVADLLGGTIDLMFAPGQTRG